MMRYKAVIFDLDGTILDTLEDLANSVNFALSQNNLPPRSLCEVRSFVGNGIRLLVERSVPVNTSESVIDKVFCDFKENYKQNSACNTRPYEGITEVLSELKARGLCLAVVSNKADFAVQTLVEEYFNNIFDYSVGEKAGVARKPAPDSVFSAASFLEVDLKECLYVGDSDVDIETARNAGVDCMCVTWGFRDREYLLTFNPDYIADSPNQIMEYIGE